MAMEQGQQQDQQEQMYLPYQVRLDQFEGPLDLLLHLIKKNEVNIYDIPIALITQQYLEYLSMMKSLNLAVAGEFLVMAATLVQIKSRMLLPSDEGTAEEDEGPDPREELVRRLLEYKRYKDAALQLDNRERLWRDIFSREQAPSVPVRSQEALLEEVTLFDLVDALQGVLARSTTKRSFEVIPENLTVRDRINAILDVLSGKDAVTFLALFEGQTQRMVIIVTFLAVLELVRLKLVRVFQAETFGPMLVTRAFSPVGADEWGEILDSLEEAEDEH
jgi:segregation and condensation protein A